jgi:oxygen-independent coproporphyrinogen-3 oxidase
MRAMAGQLTGERGVRRDAEDRRRAHVIEDLLCGRIATVAPFLAEDGLRDRLAPFLAHGLAVLEQGGLQITPGGRPYGRALTALFDRYRIDQGQRFSTAI